MLTLTGVTIIVTMRAKIDTIARSTKLELRRIKHNILLFIIKARGCNVRITIIFLFREGK